MMQNQQGYFSDQGRHLKMRLQQVPIITAILVGINILVFLVCTFTGNMLYNKGAFSGYFLLYGGEWYRLFTSLFLHASVWHLFNNMIVLAYVGMLVERQLGRVLCLILFFLSGLAGNMVSMGYELFSGQFYTTVGASGAIFGLEGALLALLLLNRGNTGGVSVRGLILSILLTLYCGFTTSGVNNAAHIGGLLMGIVAMVFIWLVSGAGRKLRRNRRQQRGVWRHEN